ncbi:MAG: phage holin family protein [Patescibacteria group bacterium]|nr:phage holin family protein [Patescibacteria group bacterium]
MNLAKIKNFIYTFLLGSMIFYITTHIVTGIEISGEPAHWLMIYAVFAISNIIARLCIKFFALPQNFIIFWLCSAIFGFCAIYAMSIILPGIQIAETLIDPMSLGIISVNPYSLSPMLTMVAGAAVSGLFGSIFNWLKRE